MFILSSFDQYNAVWQFLHLLAVMIGTEEQEVACWVCVLHKIIDVLNKLPKAAGFLMSGWAVLNSFPGYNTNLCTYYFNSFFLSPNGLNLMLGICIAFQFHRKQNPVLLINNKMPCICKAVYNLQCFNRFFYFLIILLVLLSSFLDEETSE